MCGRFAQSASLGELKETAGSLAESLGAQKANLEGQHIELAELSTRTETSAQSFTIHLSGLRDQLASAETRFETYRSAMQGSLRKLYIALGVTAAGLVGTVGYLAVRLMWFAEPGGGESRGPYSRWHPLLWKPLCWSIARLRLRIRCQ